jgi:CrcB protein
MIREILWVACGGACGAIARYAVTGASQRWLPQAMPWGTLIVNVVGCFALGALAEYHLLKRVTSHWQLVIGVGFLGALTTFSTFGHETLRLWEKGNSLHAIGNVALNLAAGLFAVAIGVQLIRMIVPAESVP